MELKFGICASAAKDIQAALESGAQLTGEQRAVLLGLFTSANGNDISRSVTLVLLPPVGCRVYVPVTVEDEMVVEVVAHNVDQGTIRVREPGHADRNERFWMLAEDGCS